MVDTDTHWLTTISQLKLPQIEMVVTSRVSKPNEHTPFTPTKNYAKWEQLYPEKACKVTYCICHLKLCSPDIIAIYCTTIMNVLYLLLLTGLQSLPCQLPLTSCAMHLPHSLPTDRQRREREALHLDNRMHSFKERTLQKEITVSMSARHHVQWWPWQTWVCSVERHIKLPQDSMGSFWRTHKWNNKQKPS